MAIPATPANVIVQQGNGQVFISWDISAGATSYSILRSVDNVTFASIASPAINNYLDTSVTVGTQYFYAVASTNGSGTSSQSSSQGVVPTFAGSMSLGQIRLLAQQEADKVNSNFVTTSEWNNYINQSAFELYDLLVTCFDDYFLAPGFQFVTDGVADTYSMPTGAASYIDVNGNVCKPFYKLMGVDLGLSQANNARVTISKFDFISRNRYVYPQITSTFLGVFNMRYRLMGNNLIFIPVPSAGQYVTVWYIPRMTQLLKDTDIADGVSGWTEYIIVDAAIKALEKEESDTSALMARKAMLKQRIEETAMNRDAGQPDTISKIRHGGGNGSYGGPGFDGSYGGY